MTEPSLLLLKNMSSKYEVKIKDRDLLGLLGFRRKKRNR